MTKALCKTLFAITIFSLGVNGLVSAQRTVNGSVRGDDGEKLAGVSVFIKGTAGGALTDANGNYRVSLPSGYYTLVFVYTGYQSREISPGSVSDSLHVVLKGGLDLPETVVTALAICREQRAVSYAIQTIGGDQLNAFGQIFLTNALVGKVAGLQMRSAPAMKLNYFDDIYLRGAGSLTGPQSPLYVVDGTPAGNGFNSFNPDDVESVSVLKGPGAAALYGQRGEGGVIVITTKTGLQSKKLGIELNQSVVFNRVAALPKYQDQYAGGESPALTPFVWQAGMPEEWKALDGKGYHDYAGESSWGARMVGQEYIPWYAWYPGSRYAFQTASLTPRPDNVRDFYETGITSKTNLNFSKATDQYSTRFSFTYQGINGQIPTTGWSRYYLSTTNTFHFNQHLILGANINHYTTLTTGQINDLKWNQTSGSFNTGFHRDLDMDVLRELRDLRSPEGILASWNHGNPADYLTGPNQFYSANYWYNYYSFFDQLDYASNEQRLFGNINLTYRVDDHWKITGFLRKNQATRTLDNKVYALLQQSGLQTGYLNAYSIQQQFTYDDNYEVLASWADRFGPLSIEANAGGNIRKDKITSIAGASSQGLIVPDVFNLGNSVVKNPPSQNASKRVVRSVYARGSLGWKSLLYVDWTVRNDWSSTLPPEHNAYTYPGVGLGFVFSELLKPNDLFSYGKLRLNWAQVGTDLAPYQLNQRYTMFASWGSNLVLTANDNLLNPNVKPSLSSAYEAGLDLRFFKNRAAIDLTYFQESKINDILNLSVAGASGVTSQLINAGRIDRKGLELQLQGMPVMARHLSWELAVNYGFSRNKILELVSDIQSQVIGATTFTNDGPFIVNDVGGRYGQLRGGGIRKIDGKPVLSNTGLFVYEPNTYFGSYVPDFTGGILNTLRYKGFSLLFTVDFQKGGKFFSLSQMLGEYNGLLESTVGVNDKGNAVRDPVAEGGGVAVSGVDDNGAPLKMYVEAIDYYRQFANSGIYDPYIHELHFVKLREISIGWDLPVKKWKISRAVQSVSAALIAQNLWLIYASDRNFDPSEIAGAGESGQYPASRAFGLNLQFRF